MSLMKLKPLFESSKLICGESRESDGAFKVRLINSGMGSSGYYSPELLERYHNVFDSVLSFRNHPEYGDPTTRDFTMIAGAIAGETWTENEEDGSVGVYGWYKPDPEHADKIERYRDKLALSIFVMGDGHVNETGVFEVDYLDGQDPYRSVDIVIAGGRGGKLAVESLRKMYENHREETPGMTIEELSAKVDALTDVVSTLVSQREAEATAEAQVEADKEAVAAALDAYAEAEEKINAAELLPSQVKALKKLAREGGDVTAGIEAAKTLLAELAQETEPKGFVLSSDNGSDYEFKGFGG